MAFPGGPPGGFGLSIKGRPKYNENSEEEENNGPNLPEGIASLESFLNAVREGTHGAKLELMKGANGSVKGVRKTAEQGKHMFADLKKEILIYERLKAKPGWKDHVLPYSRGVVKGKKAYLEMDFVPGKELFEYVHGAAAGGAGAPSKAERLELLRQTIDGLTFLLSANVLHGDLKDDNVYVAVEEGKEPKALLFDFGKSLAGVKTAKEYRDEAKALIQMIHRTVPSLTVEHFDSCLEGNEFEGNADYERCLDCIRGKLTAGEGGGGRRRGTRRARHGRKRAGRTRRA